MTRTAPALVSALAVVAALALAGSAAAEPHNFTLTYRDFGQVTADSTFRPGSGYDLRFEGCFARHSEEAICGFTLRARRPITVTNLANASHGSGPDGAPKRTCCLFVQGDPKGYPITPAADAAPGAAVIRSVLAAGQQRGFLLRAPNYRSGPPLAAITFSAGDGDPGLSTPARIVELP